MRLLFKTIFCFAAAIFLYGCQKEYSYEGGIQSAPGNGNDNDAVIKSEWRFTAGATKYSGPVDTAYLTKEGVYTVLTLTGKSSSGNEFLLIKLKTADSGFQKGKTYKTYLDETKFVYQNRSDTLYSAILYSGGDLYVTISGIGPDKVIATFTGQAHDANGQSVSITDGYFSSPVKKGSASGNGYIMLWAKTLCNGPLKVKVNNQPGAIDKSFYYTPGCGEPGAATYNLPAGLYYWVAYCGNDSLKGTATITPGGCSKVLITFPYMPAPITNTDKNCELSELSYDDPYQIPLDPKILTNHIINTYTGNAVDGVKYFVSPAPFIITHSVSYSGDTIFIDGDNQYTKYFITDTKGRVIEYHGVTDPAVFYPLPPSTLVKYYYDDQNQLIKREAYHPRYLNLISEILFIWKNGNIISTIVKSAFSSQPTITNFQYYNKEVKAMPFLNSDAFELFFFQPMINFGNPGRNLLKQKILQTLTVPVTFNYGSYIIDDNNYVLSCRMSTSTKHISFQFNYQCF